MWNRAVVDNESDVEQKIIYPLLTELYPSGLGIDKNYIKTKANVKRLDIGKGSDKKLYFPDYAIAVDGYPIAIIEAKAPGVSLEEAFREARLYATEINSSIQSGINTCKYVFAINDHDIWYGYWDQFQPINKIKVNECDSTSEELECLQKFFDLEKILIELKEVIRKSVSIEGFRPKKLLGGNAVQGEELDRNTFGSTVTSEISSIFNPISYKDRIYIAKEGYVSSRRKQRYIEPIDRLIRAANTYSITDAIEIEDTGKPKEIIKKFVDISSIDRQIMLLIGSVGSGKSTFIDYLFNKALDQSVVDTLTSLRLDMNTSPLSQEEIYSWLRNRIIDGCKNSLPSIDFDDIKNIEKVYSVEVNRIKKGEISYFEEGSNEWKNALFTEIKRLKEDEVITTQAYIRFCCTERGKTLVIALDNCDKKETKDQLLMFQVAQWLQASFRCLVILPLRDETYDNYREQPPLDTALKDLVFRIEPPLLQQVLVSRVKLALKEMKGDANETLSYSLPNGYRVEYPKSEQAYYLTSILNSMFEHNNFVRNIIVGLSGRNIRRSLEIFIELCNSAHLDESEVLKIRQSEGKHKIQFHKIVTILLRLNRRYYDGDNSYIKNIFNRNESESPVCSFSRFLILTWLKENKNKHSFSIKGYSSVKDLSESVNEIGISQDKILSEVNYLVESNCIVTEDFKTEGIDWNTLIKITPSGEIHLDLSSNITYLSTVAEECLFDFDTADRIRKRITLPDSHASYQNSLLTALDLYHSLVDIRDNYCAPFDNYRHGQNDMAINLDNLREKLDSAKSRASEDPWFEADKRYPRGSTHSAVVQNKLSYGCFVDFYDGTSSRIKNQDIIIDDFDIGDKVKVEILWVNTVEKKIGAKIVALIAEESGDFAD